MGAAQAQRSERQRDEPLMLRAIALSERGAGMVAPNPLVGCVLVKDGTIIGEGWHEGPGKDHAEIAALKNASIDVNGATAYVSLEPCNHSGRTGPCSEALVEAGITSVVYAFDDPNPIAAGGAEYLRSHGIKVRAGLCKDQARHANRAWLFSQQEKRPYVIAKAGMSLDGRIATKTGESQWITSPESRASAHQLRARVDAIIVGAGTIIADDPTLTARLDDKVRSPLRVVLDSTGRTSPGAKAFERSGRGAVLATTAKISNSKQQSYEEMGVDVIPLLADESAQPDISELLKNLYQRDVHSVMVEGGGEVLGGFFDADLIEEIELYIAPKLIGGGKPAFGGMGIDQLSAASRFHFAPPEYCGPDMLMRGYRHEGLV